MIFLVPSSKSCLFCLGQLQNMAGRPQNEKENPGLSSRCSKLLVGYSIRQIPRSTQRSCKGIRRSPSRCAKRSLAFHLDLPTRSLRFKNSPLKMDLAPIGSNYIVFQAPFFRCENVSFREGTYQNHSGVTAETFFRGSLGNPNRLR